MTEDELKAIEERAAKATPGPWRVKRYPDLPFDTQAPRGEVVTDTFIEFRTSRDDAGRPEDDTFVAAARSDVPALVAEVRRLRQRVEDLEDAIAGVDDPGE